MLLAHPIRLNLDGVSQLERVGRRAPGRTVGIRINPGAGAGYTEHLAYAGERPTKFGVTEDRLDDAIAAARRHGLVVDTMHFHAGSGWLGDQLDGFEAALARATRFLDRLLEAGCPIREVNVGGGLGRVARDGERRWTSTPTRGRSAATSARTGSRPRSSPGDLVMKDAGVLLGEVVSRGAPRRDDVRRPRHRLERQLRVLHLPVRAGGPARPRPAPGAHAARDDRGAHQRGGRPVRGGLPVPGDVAEGDVVAILNAGGYLQAMSMTHCLRPTGTAVYLERPATR